MPLIESSSPANRLLEALPRRDRRRFLAECEPVELRFSEVLADSGERIRHAYFPSDSFISLSTPANGCASLEVGLIGNEGMLGISLVLGIDVTPLRAVVQGDGSALRMDAALFRHQLALSPALLGLLNRYFYVVVGQLAQASACTRFHTLEARLARLLLRTHDRVHSDKLHLTHEALAGMLGVRRVGVTKAATSLQDRNLISYRRGCIAILNRAGLKAAACRCYATDELTYARTMGGNSRYSIRVS
jgi:CRP-like cAMP-binding protein